MSEHIRPPGLRGHIHDHYSRLNAISQLHAELGDTES